MDLRTTFEHRSGRVIAAFRVALAFVFLAALAFEPGDTGSNVNSGFILIGSYLVLALVLLGVAWRSWSYDHRLAWLLLLVDVGVFLAAVFLTEAANADFTSPFLALFALTVLSTTLRWDWAMAARTGVIVSLVFILLGFAIASTGYPLDVPRFGRRAFYMVALLLVLVWFGIDRRAAQVPPLPLGDEVDSPARFHEATLGYAMRVTGARHAILAWNDGEEPWTQLHERRADGSGTAQRIGPDELPSWEGLAPAPRLFDLARGEALVRGTRGRARLIRPAEPIPLAQRAGIAAGLAIPVACSRGDGLIVLGGIDGAGPDFLALGEAFAREIATTADRIAATRLDRESAVMRARGAIARDLHDSVAQSLAGACFRLEALRSALAGRALPPAAGDASPEEEIAAIRDALRGEQAQVRQLIDTLRDPAGMVVRRQLASDLRKSLDDAAAHWNLRADFACESAIEVPGALSHELRQLLREAVANAARHGGASEVSVSLAPAEGRLDLLIADDGKGFVPGARACTPWSISERVVALGGRLDVDSSAAGTRLAISLPLSNRLEQAS